jgi:hypothetical protein
METFALRKPIMVNGAEVKEIKYDFDNLTAQDKMNAGKAYKKAGNVISVQELDSDYHLFIFAEAVAKVNQDIDQKEIVLLLSAKDSARAEKLVRDFFFLDSEDM